MKKLFFLPLLLVNCATTSQTVNAKHFDVIKQTWDGGSLISPAGTAEVTPVLIEIPVGGETGWHKHPMITIGYMLQGDLEVALQDGRKHQFHAGEAAAEVIDTFHNGKNIGNVPVKIVVFYVGAPGETTTFWMDPLKHAPVP
jgi:quercetin dioxygenase-like cupin family protein